MEFSGLSLAAVTRCWRESFLLHENLFIKKVVGVIELQCTLGWLTVNEA